MKRLDMTVQALIRDTHMTQSQGNGNNNNANTNIIYFRDFVSFVFI